jgi:glutamate synthase (NADPH/NADH) small chain
MGFAHPERSLLEQFGVRITERGNVWRDANWMSSVEGVFSAGDMQRGQSLIVWAIAEGRSAAAGVDRFLMGGTDLPAPLR